LISSPSSYPISICTGNQLTDSRATATLLLQLG
jgi:hypothetical protein